MVIELGAEDRAAKVLSGASKGIEIIADEWIQIRRGNLNDPIVELQEQCPEGKVWKVSISVYIEESDA